MRVAALTAVSLLLACTLRAASLVGTQVSGGLYFPGFDPNYFDPANGRVPAGYLNTAGPTVTISASAVEYGFNDGYAQITADFTGAQLTITDVPAFSAHYNALQFVFTNSAVTNLSGTGGNFPSGGLTGSLEGNVITLNWPGGNVTQGVPLQAVFTINAPPVPQLSIQRTTTNSVVLSWPQASTGYNLQQKTDLASTNWTPVGIQPVLVNGRNEVVITPPTGTVYYRLQYP